MKDKIFQFICSFSNYLSKVCIGSHTRDIDEGVAPTGIHGLILETIVNKYLQWASYRGTTGVENSSGSRRSEKASQKEIVLHWALKKKGWNTVTSRRQGKFEQDRMLRH